MRRRTGLLALRAASILAVLSGTCAAQGPRSTATPLAPIAEAAPLESSLESKPRTHWAYSKVPSEFRHASVDAFIAERRAAAGLAASPRAEGARLLRRVYLDVIGLPPSIDAVDAFLSDASPKAYERVVDELLASKHFGEHWARHWLDLARYADSNGFQADQLRDSWAYRDWVIQALNAGMPFDRFTIEQIAGDLLPNASLDQKIATGFHRTVTCNVEAGVHPEANRINQVFDRVNTTGTVWLGTTMSCAQCHDHKYDPISQREYFELFAFFNNTPIEVANPSGKGVSFDFVGPHLELPLAPEKARERARLRAQRSQLESRRDAAKREVAQSREERKRALRSALANAADWETLTVTNFESTGDEDVRILDDQSVLIGGRVPGTASYRARVTTRLEGITAFKLEVLTHPSLPGTGPGRGDDARPNFILSEFSVTLRRADAAATPEQKIELRSAQADYEQKGWPVRAAIDGNPRKGWAIGGAFFQNHWAVFRCAQSLVGEGEHTLTFTLDQNFGRGRTIGRFRLSAYRGDADVLEIPEAIAKILHKETPDSKERKRLERYLLQADPAVREIENEMRACQRALDKIRPDKTLVMVEEAEARQTHILKRGDYRDKGDEVAPGTPAVLHPFPANAPKNRLGLARWLVDEDNPLVARVTVNRWWSQIFGRGIVQTEEDFGAHASPPSHPDLLDWLARELMRSGWSMKHVLRCILLSDTYCQSSRTDAQRRSADPQNLLYARGPRFRMSAEMIRDSGLRASGLLSTEMGGRPVFPPQPPGLWRQTGRNEPRYVIATDEDRYRRGVYVVWRRAAPYPSFVLFDGPDRSACHPRRSRTNTPMQALALMNDSAFVEMGLALALRMHEELQRHEGKAIAAALEHGFRRVLARRPNERERAHLLQVFGAELRRLRTAPSAVQTLLDAVPHLRLRKRVHGSEGQAEVASFFFVANVLLNLDEAITKG